VPSFESRVAGMFRIVRVELNRDGLVVARSPLQPLYELLDDAMALAEFDASRCAGDYGYDAHPTAGGRATAAVSIASWSRK
jgi:hypothetical protein